METEVAQLLLQIKAIKLNPQNRYTWASGIKSPIYCDNRKTLSYPSVRRQIKEYLVEKSADFKPFNTIAGVATAGIPHGALLADALNLPFVYVRSKAKGHGMQNLIEGELRGNERILLVEDLISTGGSSLKAARVLENFGCSIAGVLAIFTYGFQQSIDAFAEEDIRLETLSNYDALLKQACTIEYIKESDVEMLQEWRLSVGKQSK